MCSTHWHTNLDNPTVRTAQLSASTGSIHSDRFPFQRKAEFPIPIPSLVSGIEKLAEPVAYNTDQLSILVPCKVDSVKSKYNTNSLREVKMDSNL